MPPQNEIWTDPQIPSTADAQSRVGHNILDDQCMRIPRNQALAEHIIQFGRCSALGVTHILVSVERRPSMLGIVPVS